MVIKNISDGGTGHLAWSPLTRAYFNRSSKTLEPGQATAVSATLSILDVIQDITFLKDIALVEDIVFAPTTWAAFTSTVKVGDRNLALDATVTDNIGALLNPISKTAAVNAGKAKVALFLTPAEKALLQGILTASSDLIQDNVYFITSADADAIEVGLAADMETTGFPNFADTADLVKGTTYWEYTDAGGVTYVSAILKAAAPTGDYPYELGKVFAGNVSFNYFTPNGGAAAEIDRASVVIAADGAIITGVGVLSKDAGLAKWIITEGAAGGGTVFSGPASSAACTGTYARTSIVGAVVVDGADWVFNPLVGDNTTVGATATYTYTAPVVLTGVGTLTQSATNWTIVSGGVTFVGPLKEADPVGEYVATETLGAITAANVSCYSYTPAGGSAAYVGKVATINAAGTVAIADVGTLSKNATKWQIEDAAHQVYLGPVITGNAGAATPGTGYIRTVTVTSSTRVNPAAITETLVMGSVASASDVEIVAEVQTVKEEPVAEVKVVAPKAKKAKKSDTPSLADLEADNASV